jgi:hypothetical protein
MKLLISIAVFLCLGMTEKSWGCSDCVCFSDSTCSNVGCSENLTANCERIEFSPACDGNYVFATYTACTGGTAVCSKCQACANLYKLSGTSEIFIANCHTAECDAGNCGYICSSSIELSAGGTYVMYICKVPCPAPPGTNCENCPDNCKAYACLSHGVGTPCTP